MTTPPPLRRSYVCLMVGALILFGVGCLFIFRFSKAQSPAISGTTTEFTSSPATPVAHEAASTATGQSAPATERSPAAPSVRSGTPTLGAASPAPVDLPRQALQASLPEPAYLKDAKLLFQEDQSAPGDSVVRRISVYEVKMKYPLIRVEETVQKAGKEEVVIARTAAVADHVVVKTAPPLPEAVMAERVERIGGAVRKKSVIAGTYLVSFPVKDADRLPDIVRELQRQPDFQVVEPDYIATVDVTPDDSRFSQQWNLQAGAQGGIDTQQAWDLARGSSSIVVGVIDTGIDYNHPDLAPNIWTNPGEIPGNGIDDDRNGYIDDVHGWDFANNDSNPMDDHFHGTHVAGTIGAATNNNAGVAGVCWNVRLVALKFLNASGSGYLSDATEALHYANSRGVALTNNSWGGGGYSKAFADELSAARNAGSLFIAAAGNSSVNTDYSPSYPAGYDLDNVVAVAAVDRFGSLAYFSNYGATTVDLAAPGVGILSTVPTALTSAMAGYGLPTGYGSLNGTSMAAPHVAGVCTLLKAFRPSLTYDQILNALYAGGERLSSLSSKVITGARLNANRSLESLNGLLITPFGNLSYSGPTAGPFSASSNQWVLSNPGASPVSWSASSDQAWAMVSPAGGTLEPGQSAVVIGQVGVSANQFPPGQYAARISFLNTYTGRTEIRTMSLRVEGVAPMPFHDDFESGALSAYWLSNGLSWPESAFRNQVTSAYGPQGGFHLLLDASANTSAPVRNEVTVALNLQGYTGVRLQFAAKSLEDEPDGPPPQPFLQSANFDGVAVSADGVHWYEIQPLRALSAEYQQFEINLDQAIAKLGLSYSSVFKIRFNHVDNSQAPVDGIAIDNIHITGVPPTGITLTVPERLVEGQSGTAQVVRSGPMGNSLTVNLSANPGSRIAVPASVTFVAGQQTVSFAIAATDNTLLDGTASAVITAASSGGGAVQGTCFVVDNETAELSLTAPSLLNEGSGLFAEGRVSSDRPPVSDILVTLSSSRPDELQAPPTVVLPAGSTSVSFSVSATDDDRIDDTTTVVLTASVPNWSSANTNVQVADNENRQIVVTLPASVDRFSGVLQQAGRVALSGTLSQDLSVSLTSSNPSNLTVPAAIVIPAGAKSTVFDVTVLENGNSPVTDQATVTASAAGLLSGAASVAIAPGQSRVEVVKQLTGDLVFNPASGRLLFSVPQHAVAAANSVGQLNPTIGVVEAMMPIGNEPGLLRLANDNQTLYCSINGGRSIRTLNLSTLIPGTPFSLGVDPSRGAYLVDDMEPLPGQPSSLAVSRRWNGASPRHAGVAVFDNGSPRPATTAPLLGSNVVEFASPTELLGYNQETEEFGFRKMQVSPDGVTVSALRSDLLAGYGTNFKYDGGRCYATSGAVVDPASMQVVATLPATGLVCPSAVLNRLCYLQQTGSVATLWIFEQQSLNLIGTIPLSGLSGTATSLVQCGSDRVAFRTPDQVYLVRTTLLSSGADAALLVNPAANVLLTGRIGESLPSARFTAVNTGGAPLNCAVSTDAAWLNLSHTVVDLGASASTVITATPNASAQVLPIGTYTATIQFTNTSNDVGSTSRTVTLTIQPPNSPPSISSVADQTSGGDVPIGPLAFTVNDADAPASELTVTATSSNPALIPDDRIQAAGNGTNRTVTLSALRGVSGTAQIKLTVSDGIAAASTQFTVTVNAVNDPPILTAIPDQAVNEDQVAESIAFTVNDPETDGDSLIVTTASSNTALLPAGNIFVAGAGVNRQLFLRPAQNASGSAVVTVIVSDGELSASRSFTLTVKPVNDAPTLNPLPDISLNAGAGTQTVGLSGITSGAFNESQTLTVLATSNNPALLPNPTVSYSSPGSTGTISFTPAAGAGVATITVTVADNGGTADGGQNQTVRTFNVRIGVPTISGFSPASGPVGSLVTITGSNFDPTPGLNSVYFGAAPAQVLSGTPQQLVVLAPPGATHRPISVTARKLTAFSSKPFNITFANTQPLNASAFGPRQTIPKPLATSEGPTALADLNGDGKLDVLAKATSGVHYSQNNSSDYVLHPSMFSPGVTIGLLGADGGDVGDLDGDGKLEVVGALSSGTNYGVAYSRNMSTSAAISMATAVSISGNGGGAYQCAALADFDGDGRLDVVAGSSSGFVSVFRNTSGSVINFAPRFDISTGGYNHQVHASDIDGDGKPDIVVADITNSKIVLLRNQSVTGLSTASFSAPYTISMSWKPYGIRVADLDGDGKNDLMATGYLDSSASSNAVAIFRNIGTSGTIDATSFASSFNLQVGNQPRSIQVGDLNGDGKPDMVVAQLDTTTREVLSIYFNQSSPGSLSAASFSSRVPLHLSEDDGYLVEPAIGDIDSDGKPDIAAGSSGLIVNLWKNQFGSGLLPAVTSISPAAAFTGAAIQISGTSFHADPELNIVYFGKLRAQVLSASLTNLTVQVPPGTSVETISVTINGRTAYSPESFYTLIPGTKMLSATSFGNGVNFGPGTSTGRSSYENPVVAGDIDQDGKIDIVLSRSAANSVSVYRNTHPGGAISTSTLASPIELAANEVPIQAVLRDIDGDGKPDLCVVSPSASKVGVFRNMSSPGSISFAARIDFTIGGWERYMECADIDLDGKLDLLFADETGGGGGNSATILYALRNTSTPGAVSFAAPAVFNFGGFGNYTYQTVARDFDGDGKVDWAGATLSDIKYGRGNSAPGAIVLNTPSSYTWRGRVYLNSADLDGDSKPDLVSISSKSTFSRRITTGRNTSTSGTISFAWTEHSGGTDFGSPSIAELDGDGRPDLMVTKGFESKKMAILQNFSTQGSIGLGEAVELGLPYNSIWAIAADLNQDGRNDIITSSATASTFTVFENNVANTAPEILPLADQVTNEDQMTATIPVYINDVGTPAENLTMTVASSNTLLVPAANIQIGGRGSLRTLRLTPSPDWNGVSTITVTVSDGEVSQSASFKLTVNPVNDQPSLDPLPPVTVVLGSGMKSIPLTGITCGSAQETQALAMSATCDNPALVSSLNVKYASPASTAELEIMPSTGVAGRAIITVTVTDNGGTANGGVNQVSRTLPVVIVTKFEGWRRRQFSDDHLQDVNMSGQMADPDRDGVSNLFEYAFGGNAWAPSSSVLPQVLITQHNNGSYLTLIYRRRTDDNSMFYRVESSADLDSWSSDLGDIVEISALDNGDGTEVVTMRGINPISSSTKRFLRVRVTNAP